LTGAIHLDGFADTCDGFYAGQFGAREDEIITIMKDPHIGTIGAIGITVVIILKFSFLLGLSISNASILFLLPVISRWTALPLSISAGYPKAEGVGKIFVEKTKLMPSIISTLFCLVIVYLFSGIDGLAVMFITGCVVLLFKIYVIGKLGAVTGDIIGACIEISELVVLGIFAFL
jgi:adenosylcobinamide-GDP ribazoletransferase